MQNTKEHKNNPLPLYLLHCIGHFACIQTNSIQKDENINSFWKVLFESLTQECIFNKYSEQCYFIIYNIMERKCVKLDVIKEKEVFVFDDNSVVFTTNFQVN